MQVFATLNLSECHDQFGVLDSAFLLPFEWLRIREGVFEAFQWGLRSQQRHRPETLLQEEFARFHFYKRSCHFDKLTGFVKVIELNKAKVFKVLGRQKSNIDIEYVDFVKSDEMEQKVEWPLKLF